MKKGLAWWIFRPVVLLIALLGVLLYCFWLWIGIHAWIEAGHDRLSLAPRIGTFLAEVVFGSGLAPLMIAIYFFVLCKRAIDWTIGLLFLSLFIFTEFVTEVFIAHASWVIYTPILLTDLGAAVGVILMWEHHSRSADADAVGTNT